MGERGKRRRDKPTVIDRHYRPDQSLARLAKGRIEGITVYYLGRLDKVHVIFPLPFNVLSTTVTSLYISYHTTSNYSHPGEDKGPSYAPLQKSKTKKKITHTQPPQKPIIIPNHQEAQRSERRDRGQECRTLKLAHDGMNRYRERYRERKRSSHTKKEGRKCMFVCVCVCGYQKENDDRLRLRLGKLTCILYQSDLESTRKTKRSKYILVKKVVSS